MLLKFIIYAGIAYYAYASFIKPMLPPKDNSSNSNSGGDGEWVEYEEVE